MTSTSYLGSTSIVAAVRPRPEHRRRRARRAGGDQRGARPPARRRCRTTRATARSIPADAPDPDPGAHLRHARRRGQMYDAASTILQQKLSQVEGVGQVIVGGSSLPARARGAEPDRAQQVRHRRSKTCAPRSPRPTRTGRRASSTDGDRAWEIDANDQLLKAAEYRRSDRRLSQRRGACGSADVADVEDSVEDVRNAGLANGKPAVLIIDLPAARAPTSSRPSTACAALLPQLQASIPRGDRPVGGAGPHHDHPRLAARCRAHAGDLDRAGDPGGVRVPAERARHADPERGGAGLADRHLRRDVPAAATASTTCR